jgi:hypothetical protein
MTGRKIFQADQMKNLEAFAVIEKNQFQIKPVDTNHVFINRLLLIDGKIIFNHEIIKCGDQFSPFFFLFVPVAPR